jgi:hypothetical protein
LGTAGRLDLFHRTKVREQTAVKTILITYASASALKTELMKHSCERHTGTARRSSATASLRSASHPKIRGQAS